MKIGPITPTPISVNPLKPVQVKTTHGRHVVMFGGAFPVPMQADVVEYTIPVPIMGATAELSRALVAQLTELGSNADWQRAGIYLQMRDDLDDAQDGWYGLGAISVPEEEPAQRGWVNSTIDVLLRRRRASSIGVMVDQKTQPNDYSFNGVALGAYPQGVGSGFPAATWTFAGADGSSIEVIEDCPNVISAPFTSPNDCMTKGRCVTRDVPV